MAIRLRRGNRTQKDLAEHSGLSNTQWSKYERGRAAQQPRHETLVRIAEALGCTLRELMETARRIENDPEYRRLVGSRTPAAPSGDLPLPTHDVDLLRRVDSLDVGEELREEIRSFLIGSEDIKVRLLLALETSLGTKVSS
ncbi:MAG: helix-turn-helix transcriptional regulator [Acidobacteriota bacterium]